MKITTANGDVFEGTMAEYEAFIALGERKAAEEETAKPEAPYEYKVGDKVRMLSDSLFGKAYKGMTGVVEDEADEGGPSGLFKPENLELISEEIITFEGAEYRKVDREAREGDVVIARQTTGYAFKKDYPYKVECIGKSGPETRDYVIYRPKYGRTLETVDVYELVAKEQAPKFAVGDYVKVVKSELGNEGKIVQITDDSDGLQMRKANGDVVDADYVGIPVGDTEVYGFTEDQLVAATDEEIAEVSKPKLKAGDFVKFAEGTPSILAGKLYEVFEDDGLYFVDEDGDQRWHHFGHAHEIVDAETVKWAKLGRKVGEFRKGDIVRASKMIQGHTKEYGGYIGKIEDVGCEMVGIRYNHGYCGAYTTDGNVELIAPVEAVLA